MNESHVVYSASFIERSLQRSHASEKEGGRSQEARVLLANLLRSPVTLGKPLNLASHRVFCGTE